MSTTDIAQMTPAELWQEGIRQDLKLDVQDLALASVLARFGDPQCKTPIKIGASKIARELFGVDRVDRFQRGLVWQSITNLQRAGWLHAAPGEGQWDPWTYTQVAAL